MQLLLQSQDLTFQELSLSPLLTQAVHGLAQRVNLPCPAILMPDFALFRAQRALQSEVLFLLEERQLLLGLSKPVVERCVLPTRRANCRLIRPAGGPEPVCATGCTEFQAQLGLQEPPRDMLHPASERLHGGCNLSVCQLLPHRTIIARRIHWVHGPMWGLNDG